MTKGIKNYVSTLLVLAVLLFSIVPLGAAQSIGPVLSVAWDCVDANGGELEEFDALQCLIVAESSDAGALQNPTYTWTFSDGSSSSKDPLRTPTTAGTYTAELYVEDMGGDRWYGPATKSFEVKAKNIQPLILGVTSAKEGQIAYTGDMISFTSTVTDSGNPNTQPGDLVYVWDFGDGSQSFAENGKETADHPFTFPGDYTVTLTVQDNRDPLYPREQTASTTVKVLENGAVGAGFDASISATQQSGSSPLTVSFNAVVPGNQDDYTYTWTFPDNYKSDSATPVFTFYNIDPAGNDLKQTVQLYTENKATGAFDQDSVQITITTKENTPPEVKLKAPLGGERNERLTFHAEATDAENDFLSYDWNFGDGTPGLFAAGDTVTHSYKEKGVYLVTVTVFDSHGAPATQSEVVTIGGPAMRPVATPVASELTGTAPLVVSFVGTGTDFDGEVVAYRWDFGDGTTSIEQNPVHTYTYTGIYEATLEVTDDEGWVSSPESLTIQVTAPLPSEGGAPVMANIPDQEAVKGENFTYQVLAAHPFDDTLTYSATGLPEGSSINSEFGLISGVVTDDLGDYTVVVTVKDTRAASASSTFNLKVVSNEPEPERGTADIRVARARVLEGEYLNVGEYILASIKVANDGNEDAEDLTVRVTVPQLGLQRSLVIRDLDDDDSEVKSFSLQIPEYAPLGEYTLRITVSNDDTRRFIHRTFEVVE
jgi:PKD repeat protein